MNLTGPVAFGVVGFGFLVLDLVSVFWPNERKTRWYEKNHTVRLVWIALFFALALDLLVFGQTPSWGE
ncbi:MULTISPECIES: hypothetical protein [unclassified Ruegeria]|uniref:hypothetical protein n=1 Tax=unclassified Ruegeria TaxID=2625375 RepID=UPI001AD9852B|nr:MULTISPECIES: hypothetical protein [unclassified Ruegeria]MBO9413004.1 hypothetical protein [Ruegeria sp. R8_1]MBO9417012.1 hypothetical protein [Ruegeria sp. R8_2]